MSLHALIGFNSSHSMHNRTMLNFNSIYLDLFTFFSAVMSYLASFKSTMTKCISFRTFSSEDKRNNSNTSNSLPIDKTFNLPFPPPLCPTGRGFATGTIDLGGLQLRQIVSFNKVWTIYEGGQDNLGATFFEPSSIPEGFFPLGYYAQPNNKPLFGSVLVGKDVSRGADALRKPTDYTLVWSSQSLKIKQDTPGYIWYPVPPNGYNAVGLVITTSPNKPSFEKIQCVRADLTDPCESDGLIWGSNEFNVYGTRPVSRGVQAPGVSVGTFVTQDQRGSTTASIVCLKNTDSNLCYMPNLRQVQALVETYSPWIYFHPDEQYLPSTVNWFFSNGALLYKRGDESNPVPIQPNGSNLPQGGANDGEYWQDLPKDENAKERAKRGDLQTVGSYFHIKPMLGGTFTDLSIWIFYPFNGPATAKVSFLKHLSLGKIGEHVGDWEHLTLRISNFNGKLKGMFFSQHSGGQWVDAPELEYQNGNKPVAYASLHGHAFYPKPGTVMQGSDAIRIRNDTAKSNMVMDTGTRYALISAEYLGVIEPPWVNYYRKWGPKIEYDIGKEIDKVSRFLPGSLKRELKKVVESLPDEVLGEEGPVGPKMKRNWNGDEV